MTAKNSGSADAAEVATHARKAAASGNGPYGRYVQSRPSGAAAYASCSPSAWAGSSGSSRQYRPSWGSRGGIGGGTQHGSADPIGWPNSLRRWPIPALSPTTGVTTG